MSATAEHREVSAARLPWPLRLFVLYFVVDLVFRSFTALMPIDDWMDDLALRFEPLERLPLAHELTAERLFRSLRAGGAFLLPSLSDETREAIESPSDWGKLVLAWPSSRLDFLGRQIGTAHAWTMFSPNVVLGHRVARCRLVYADRSRREYRLITDPRDLTHFSRWFVERELEVSRKVSDNTDTRIGYSHYLAHHFGTNERGAELRRLEWFDVYYWYPPPGEDPEAFLRAQNGPPLYQIEMPFWVYDVAEGRGRKVDIPESPLEDPEEAEDWEVSPAVPQLMALLVLGLSGWIVVRQCGDRPGALGACYRRFTAGPLGAERLAVLRITFAFLLLADQIVQYLPNLDLFFGAGGLAPAGVHDLTAAEAWNWPILLFHGDSDLLVYGLFALWQLATLAFLLGFHTRIAGVSVWLLTHCFQVRSPDIVNTGDTILLTVIVVLALSASGEAWSLDALRRRHRQPDRATQAVHPWAVRTIQLLACLIYLTTGLAKLRGHTWWEGVSMHYVLNDLDVIHWSYAQVPVPFWLSTTLNYLALALEVLFLPLVLWKRTRFWTLVCGVSLHLGIFVMMEIGWFSFYMIGLYAAWIPDATLERVGRPEASEGVLC